MRMLLQIRAWLWYKRIDLFSVRLVSDELFTSALHIWFSRICSFRSCMKRKTNLQHFYPSAEERCIGQKTKHGSKRTKKLAATSSKWVTTMKIPVVAVGSTTGFKNSSRALPEPGASWTNRTALRGTPSVFVSVCVCAAQCVIYCAAAPAGPGIQWTVSGIASSHQWPAKPHAADLASADPENKPENLFENSLLTN